MVLADLPDPLAAYEIGAAVADVRDDGQLRPRRGGDKRRPHVQQRRLLRRAGADGVVGHTRTVAERLPELLRAHAGVQRLRQLRSHRLHGDGARLTAPAGAAHSVAHGRHKTVRHLLDEVCVLILLAHKAGVRDAPNSHDRASPSLSCMTLRRSWPQDASISPPRLRRTVAVTPCDSSRF